MGSIGEELKKAEAWHEGHTEFRNGFHGNGWLEKDAVVRNPKFLDQVAKLQANQISQEFPETDLLMGPITGGAIIASYVAKHLGTEFGVILGKQGPIVFHDMNIPENGESVVLVEDIISSGVDMKRFVNFLKQSGTNVIGISVWMNRKDEAIGGVKMASLLATPFEMYEKDKCPLCTNGAEVKYADVRE